MPSHNYTYSFEPKADFSSVYASSKEIADYLEGFATKYDLWKHIRTSHRVTEASWDPARGQWDVTAIVTMTDQAGGAETTVTVRDSCHILVHATGYLNKPAWPSVPGLERFRGAKLHSAAWDESVSLAGKRVLLVGSGASSVQILPAIQPVAESVTVFIRTPRWTLPSPSSSNGGRGGKFSPEDLERFANDPDAVLNLRLENERTLNSFFSERSSFPAGSSSLLWADLTETNSKQTNSHVHERHGAAEPGQTASGSRDEAAPRRP